MFTVEGIIGAGKSTLIDTLRGAGYVVASEPVNQWVVGSINLLERFYTNPERYAYLFQIHVLETLVQQTRKVQPPPGFHSFQERSLASNALFAKLQHEIGYLDDVEHAAYQQRYEAAVAQPDMRVRGRIFLNMDVDTAMERVRIRNRAGERVTASYQKKLFDAHEDWKRRERSIGRPILEIDASQVDVRGPEVVKLVRDFIARQLPGPCP